MPGRHCSTVSGGTLVTSLWDRITTASSFGRQPSTDSAATSADHIWRSGVCCRLRDPSSSSAVLPVFWKDSSSQSTCVSSALEALEMMHYRNPRFTLHYITYTNFIFTFLVALFQWELGQEWNYDAMGPTGVVCRGSGVGGKGQNYMKLVAHKMMRNNYNTANKVHIAANELPQLLSRSTNVWRASDRTKTVQL